ncbi:MAG TPA: DUF6580 family putative transport protein [Acidobacteriaceae bacterium]|nr:DUF6580 family putative transport protein [Acidobacteriaceae bacterium]
MIAYLVLVFAALSRLLPHTFHSVGLNITAVGGGLLFFGSRRPRWQVLFAVALMALTDVYLTRVVYGYPFHPQAYVITWLWYGAACVLGSVLLQKVTPVRVAAAVLSSATGFFLLSNFVVWASGSMYPHNGSGFTACYVAALPFYANDLVSTGLTAGVLFGLPVLAGQIVRALQGAANSQRPLA